MRSRQLRETASWVRAGPLHAFAALVCLYGAVATAAPPPTLYRQPNNESPVSGGPDDLLLLAGYGFSKGDVVLYQAVSNTTSELRPPSVVPRARSWRSGLASVVSTADTPYSLTVRLPRVFRATQSYALWVRTSSGNWSRPVLINDARPLWISPAFVYARGSVANLPRELKLVGRNLEPAPGHATLLRLIGPTTLTLTAETSSSSVMDRHVARVELPTAMAPGRYSVAVNRDGSSWVALRGQRLDVRPDPPPQRTYHVSDPLFGGCRPNDGRDDTGCIVNAIADASSHGGGVVEFGAGTWDLIDYRRAGTDPFTGILVPPGVSLRGDGAMRTLVVRHSEWSPAAPAFTVTQYTTVSGFTFHDAQRYEPLDKGAAFIQLGMRADHIGNIHAAGVDTQVRDITVTRDVFDKTYEAIAAGGLPIEGLFLTDNVFGAYKLDLGLTGNRFVVTRAFRIDDSVIDSNTFEPGSYLYLPGRSGSSASELGASYRVDLSDNVADGTATERLYSPHDARGWRAAFFWSMNNDNEMLLVSRNAATCTGDKIGDGEAISYDNNANTFAFAGMRTALRADRSSVTVNGPLASHQNDRPVDVDDYYVGHWIQIGNGPGLGEVRKISRYHIDPVTHRVTFYVTPAWDVIPVAGATRLSVGREYWQVLTLSNRIDQRSPPCLKSNRSNLTGGQITLWAQTADSVVAGNRQYDTSGIVFNQTYQPPRHPCRGCTAGTSFQSFVAIKNNLVDGEYDWKIDCSSSGIEGTISAAPWGGAPPTLSYGVTISHNRVIHADAEHGGSISLTQAWYAGPPPHRWPLVDNLLLYGNVIEDEDGPAATAKCDRPHPRMGIAFPGAALTWRTVVYGNVCRRTSIPYEPGGFDTVRVCPSVPNACSCGKSLSER